MCLLSFRLVWCCVQAGLEESGSDGERGRKTSQHHYAQRTSTQHRSDGDSEGGGNELPSHELSAPLPQLLGPTFPRGEHSRDQGHNTPARRLGAAADGSSIQGRSCQGVAGQHAGLILLLSSIFDFRHTAYLQLLQKLLGYTLLDHPYNQLWPELAGLVWKGLVLVDREQKPK